jgi:8-oxo-dGTP diphosphatase
MLETGGPMEVRVVAAAIVRNGRVLAAHRGPGMLLAGCWELPGGKVEPGEADRDALRREIAEELGIEVGVGAYVGESVHDYPRVTVRLVAYLCGLEAGEPVPTEHDELRWLDPVDLGTLEWAPADVPLITALVERLRPQARSA